MEHCFYHPEKEAVAICSKCGKPLCKECAIEYKGKVYCKDCLEEIKKKEAENKKPQKKEESVKSEKSEKTVPPKTESTTRETAKTVMVAIIVSAIIIGGIILLAIILRPKSGNGFVEKNSGRFSGNEVSIPFNGSSIILKANIDNSGINIVKSGKTGKIEVSGKNTRPKVTFNGNTLTVSYENFFPWSSNKDKEITVFIPQNVKSINFDINVKIGSTSVSLPGIKVTNAEIKTAVGSTDLENFKAEYLKINDGVGSVTLTSVSASNCTVKNGTGTCTITGGEFGILNAKEGTGTFSVSSVNKIRTFSYSGGTGELNTDFSQTSPPMNATIQTGMGETEIKVGGNPARVTVTAGMGFNGSSFPVTGKVLTFGNTNKPHLEITIISGGKVHIGR